MTTVEAFASVSAKSRSIVETFRAMPQERRLRIYLIVILLLNFFVRNRLDRASSHLHSFLIKQAGVADQLHQLQWWEYFLPVKCLTGSWCTTGLLTVHALELLTGSYSLVFYLLNSVMIATGFVLSWKVFRSTAFTVTFALCLALTTFNHHTYLISGGVGIPLIVSYLLFFLYCQYKIMQPQTRLAVWAPLGIAAMWVYALSYESWLDCVAVMWIVYPILIVVARKHGYRERAKRATAMIAVVTLTTFVYVAVKVTLGHGQVGGSESDTVFNYGLRHVFIAGDDVISHFFTMFYIAASTYLPPELFSYSNALWWYGPEPLIETQHGYHSAQQHLVVYNHLFLWRYYAGFAAAFFMIGIWKVVKSSWTAPSKAGLACLVFSMMTLIAGATHTLVKFRPMHSAPFLGYHSYVGVVGVSLLIALGVMYVHTHWKNQRAVWIVTALVWLDIGYCALARPSLLSEMAVRTGFAPYPDAMDNLRSMLGL